MSTYTIIDQSSKNVDVCIAMLAYNHEKYIVEAIESVLFQKTSYSYKIIIAEDCSTDCTREIVLNYQKKYPDKFKLILQQKNVGASKNNYDLLSNLEGKYIAALEGDDYWIDPLKLQKQVDFLEANDEYVSCFTNAKLVNEINTSEQIFVQSFEQGTIPQKVVVLSGGGLYPTASLIFRREKLDLKILEEITELAGDDLLIINLSIHGKLFFLDILSCVYRRWKGGVYSKIYNNTEEVLQNKKQSIVGLKKLRKGSKCPLSIYLKLRISKESLYILKKGKLKMEFKYIKYLTVKDFIRFGFSLIKA